MLIYLDQNYASRVGKYLLGQRAHDTFGEFLRVMRLVRPLVPPSPFHVLETRGGYLLPTLQLIFSEFSPGLWVRPYQEVVRLQADRGGIDRRDLLSSEGAWSRPATFEPLDDLLELPLSGSISRRRVVVRELLAERFEVPLSAARHLPFFDLLSQMVAFRSTDNDRADQPSDLNDLLMAATIAPYVDALGTDRYAAEVLRRVGFDRPLFSGRRSDVLRFAAWLDEQQRLN